jgi:hypothetical protein
MKVSKIYINTYKYDFHFAAICAASVRYWYPEIPIFLIKDTGSGEFDTIILERAFNVSILQTKRRKFGWGFGKWEPLFDESRHGFLVLDADTAMTGPVLDVINEVDVEFIVDEEIQPSLDRFNEIYYDRDKISEINPHFKVPDYSFNEGQWFGTSGILKRSDFDEILNWTEPPTPKYPKIVKQGAQGHLNYTFQLFEQLSRITIARKKIMIWPEGSSANFIDLESIKLRTDKYPYIVHWAGFSVNNLSNLPRYDIIQFYKHFFYSKIGYLNQLKLKLVFSYFLFEKRIFKLNKRVMNLNTRNLIRKFISAMQ